MASPVEASDSHGGRPMKTREGHDEPASERTNGVDFALASLHEASMIGSRSEKAQMTMPGLTGIWHALAPIQECQQTTGANSSNMREGDAKMHS